MDKLYPMSYSHQLFDQNEPIHGFQENYRRDLSSEVLNYDSNIVASSTEEQLYSYFYQKALISSPQLRANEAYMEEEPREINIRAVRRDWGDDELVEYQKKALEFTVCVPFEGSGSLLRFRPSSYTFSLSGQNADVQIRGSCICLTYKAEISNADDLKRLYEGDVSTLAQNFKALERDIDNLNQNLPSLIRQKVAERKKQVDTNKSVISGITLPIKRRSDVPATYSIPEVRRKPEISLKPLTGQKPEPTLPEDEYEHILMIIRDMSVAMERSPSTFSKLKEPEIRDFFLILLNGHYQGMATGETFNGEGKTDILIRYQNANAFIGECKFWKGKKELTDAIDQLFGYVTWRDTKTAIIIFHKEGNLSSVLKQIDTIFQEHPNYKSKHLLQSAVLKSDPAVFSYKLTHPADTGKEVIVSVLAYQVSVPESKVSQS